MIDENNIPLSCVSSLSFRRFIGLACPDWEAPSRYILSSDYVPELALEADQEFQHQLRTNNLYLSIEFDHWLDANNRSLLGVIVSYGQGSRYVCDLIDVSISGHSSKVIVEKVAKC